MAVALPARSLSLGNYACALPMAQTLDWAGSSAKSWIEVLDTARLHWAGLDCT